MSVSRRDALKRLTALGLVAAGGNALAGLERRASAAGAEVATAARKLFRIDRVAEGVFAAIARPNVMINSNAAIVVNDDHVLVVDTHQQPSAAKALIRQIREEVTEKPVRYVVDSHFHGDHAMGNLAYPEVFGSSAEIISSNATREWLDRLGVPRLKETLEGIPKQIADLRALREKSRDEAERAGYASEIEDLEAYAKEMTPPKIGLPTLTFDQRLVIHRSGREIHLIFLGRAHTAGDVVAYLPKERVVATGDMMHGLLPYMGDGFPDEWPATLKALEALDFDRVIPGHGSVQTNKSVLAEFRAYIEEINETVARGVERGDSLEDLRKRVTHESLKSLNSASRAFDRVVGEMKALSSTSWRPEEMTRENVKSNVGEVYEYYRKKTKG